MNERMGAAASGSKGHGDLETGVTTTWLVLYLLVMDSIIVFLHALIYISQYGHRSQKQS